MTAARRHIDDEQRRARLWHRHRLAAGGSASDVVTLAGELCGLHATDPATVFLSAQARVAGLAVGDVEAELYDARRLLKHLGMRRTVFVFPTTLVPTIQAACTDAVAATERRRLVADIERGGAARDGRAWLRRAEQAVLERLAQGEATGAQLSRDVKVLQRKLTYAEGKPWGGEVGVATRVFTVMAAEGRIVRGRPSGRWTSSQHRWALAPDEPPKPDADDARAALVARWLAAFGPAPVTDIVWWTGLGVTKVRAALERIAVQEVDLDDGTGVALADDVERDAPAIGAEAALLPSLDPTVMGWQRRDFFLAPHAGALFDRNGNAGPTVWWRGRVVGGWVQRADGSVAWELLEDIGADGSAAVAQQAAALERWLDGTVVTARFPTPLATALRA